MPGLKTGNYCCLAFAAICRRALVIALGMCLCQSPDVAVAAGFEGSEYYPRGKCGPYPRAQVKTPDWACVGLVAGPDRGFTRPRSILQVSESKFVITDMVKWTARRRGKIFLLDTSKPGRRRVSILFNDRNVPHGLAMGPDGWVYVGDEDRIWRFSMSDPQGSAETVLDGLPAKLTRSRRFENISNHWHPLSHIRFDLNGNLLINIGAPRDSCALKGNRSMQNPMPCPWVDGPNPQAAVWSLSFDWPQGAPGRPGAFKPLARGLRNSMALAVHPRSGMILQAENNIDIWGKKSHPRLPPEELNILQSGGHYGWPYCAGKDLVNPVYRGRVKNCGRFKRPVVLMPAHAAPIGMTYYFGRMFPELSGKLVVALHGFRKWGQRIVAYDAGEDGRPIAPPSRSGQPGLPLVLVGNWSKRRGVRPKGRPIGFAVGRDGAIWFIDDYAKTVMVLLRKENADSPRDRGDGGSDGQDSPLAVAPAPAGWSEIYSTMLQGQCRRCHAEFTHANTARAWEDLVLKGFVDPGDIVQSSMVQRMLGQAPVVPCRPLPVLRNRPPRLPGCRPFLPA